MNLDLHVHSSKSHDCFMNIKLIKEVCKQNNINCIAITDHDTIGNAFDYKKFEDDSFKIIIGKEISSKAGDIIGLFLTKSIPKGLSAIDTVKEIKKQKGIVMIPHPFDRITDTKIEYKELIKIIDYVDIIEVYNSRTLFQNDNKKAFKFAKKHNKLMVANSDAHNKFEIGNAYTEIQEFLSKDEFLSHLNDAKIHTKRSKIIGHVISLLLTIYGIFYLLFKKISK